MVLVLVKLVMTKPRSPKTVCICVFFCVFGIGDFAGSSVRKIYIFHLVAKSPLLVCHFTKVAFVVLSPTKLVLPLSDFNCDRNGFSGLRKRVLIFSLLVLQYIVGP